MASLTQARLNNRLTSLGRALLKRLETPGKAGIAAEVLHLSAGRPSLSARMIKPSDGALHWFIDLSAATSVLDLAPVGDKSFEAGEEGSRLR